MTQGVLCKKEFLMKLILALIIAVGAGYIENVIEKKKVLGERETKFAVKLINLFTGGAIVAISLLL
jgi:hypothetical protein